MKAENEALRENNLSIKERVTTANTKIPDNDKSIADIKYNKGYDDGLGIESDDDALEDELDLLRKSFHNIKEMRETLK